MSTLENRPNTALLVVDVQNGVVEGAHQRDAVVANVASLVEKARRGQVPLGWGPHSDKRLSRGGGKGRVVSAPRPGEGAPPRRKKDRAPLQVTHPPAAA